MQWNKGGERWSASFVKVWQVSGISFILLIVVLSVITRGESKEVKMGWELKIQ